MSDMICRQYRIYANNPDEAAVLIRNKYEPADYLIIKEVSSPYKHIRWFEYMICWKGDSKVSDMLEKYIQEANLKISDSQKRILQSRLKGKKDKEIAEENYISFRTVKNHLRFITYQNEMTIKQIIADYVNWLESKAKGED